jgi:hypothetical protein
MQEMAILLASKGADLNACGDVSTTTSELSALY